MRHVIAKQLKSASLTAIRPCANILNCSYVSDSHNSCIFAAATELLCSAQVYSAFTSSILSKESSALIQCLRHNRQASGAACYGGDLVSGCQQNRLRGATTIIIHAVFEFVFEGKAGAAKRMQRLSDDVLRIMLGSWHHWTCALLLVDKQWSTGHRR